MNRKVVPALFHFSFCGGRCGASPKTPTNLSSVHLVATWHTRKPSFYTFIPSSHLHSSLHSAMTGSSAILTHTNTRSFSAGPSHATLAHSPLAHTMRLMVVVAAAIFAASVPSSMALTGAGFPTEVGELYDFLDGFDAPRLAVLSTGNYDSVRDDARLLGSGRSRVSLRGTRASIANLWRGASVCVRPVALDWWRVRKDKTARFDG